MFTRSQTSSVGSVYCLHSCSHTHCGCITPGVIGYLHTGEKMLTNMWNLQLIDAFETFVLIYACL